MPTFRLPLDYDFGTAEVIASVGVKNPDKPDSPETTGRPRKAEMVAPLFVPPACWVIPVATYGPNGGKIDRSAIGRSGSQRKAVAKCISPRLAHLLPLVEHFYNGGRVRVSMTRLGAILDGDNLQYSMKAVRDTIALFFGSEDNDRRFIWEYGQEKVGRVGVRIQITKEISCS